MRAQITPPSPSLPSLPSLLSLPQSRDPDLECSVIPEGINEVTEILQHLTNENIQILFLLDQGTGLCCQV